MAVFLRYLLRLGPANPIAVRLVQNGSRRLRHQYIRAVYLAALIIALLWALLANTGAGDLDYRQLAQAGANSFMWIAYLQIALICVLAPVFMAGAIAQEANPKTWEILLSTPMTAPQIVLGNLFGRLFFILALLVASLPLFALTQYFGGVPGTSILASYLIAACLALLVGAVAISLSVSRLVGARAVFAFYVSVVSYIALTAALDRWVGGGNTVSVFTWVNPFLALQALLNPSGYPRGDESALWVVQHPVTAWCVGSAVLSLVLAVAGTLTVRTGGLQGQQRVRGVPWYRRALGLSGADGEGGRPPRSVWMNPVAWREAMARNATLGRIVARWTFIGAGALLGIGLVVYYHVGGFDHAEMRGALLAVLWAELLVIVLVGVNMSATAVTREREDGTLDLLLTTMLTPGQYLGGKLRGLVAYLLPLLAVPLGTLALVAIYVLMDGFGRDDGVIQTATLSRGGETYDFDLPVVLPEAALAVPLVAVPFVAFTVMVGLLWSLKSRGMVGAVMATVGIIAVVGGSVGLCGWKAGEDVGVIGPALAGMSPSAVVYAALYPAEALREPLAFEGRAGPVRGVLLIGSLVAAAVYVGLTYALYTGMLRNFDMTVRRLAGER